MDVNNFDSMRIGLASPDKIREWSHGEVLKPETINYRTLKPEKDGLFCEKIFGPTRDWECHCGKYKRIRHKGTICDRCGVEVTRSKVRRERMGHIELAAPVSHIWYFKGIPSRMGLILDIPPRAMEKVLYFASYIVLDPKDTPLSKKQLLSELEYRKAREDYGRDFVVGMGAEAIKELLVELEADLPEEQQTEDMKNGLDVLHKELTDELKHVASQQRRIRAIRRLEVVEAFRRSGNKPSWMIMDVVPVIPPELRPMVQLDGGRFATSDLNDLYRRVINRNNRLKRLLELRAPDIIVRNEKRMLQEAVDALIDNGRRGRPVTGPGNRPLKSLSDMLKGKQGRFRQNLLGKRVDYSGRSVIVVGPELKMHQCGLPKEMAIELFKPFVMKRLVETGVASNIKSARKMVERANNPAVWDSLEVVIKDHPVMLNRAPTLHRLGIQAFEPVLVEGRAIKLHPLACTAFNADFDGDQMAVHVPLSAEAQAEARMLMLAANNLLKPSDGKPVTVPTQDMVIGSYYLTMIKEGEPGQPKFYKDEARTQEVSFADVKADINKDFEDPRDYISNPAILCEISEEELAQKYGYYRSYKIYRDKDEAMMAYQEGSLGMHSPAKIRVTREVDGVTKSAVIITTIGRIIFNNPVPQDLGFVDRTDPAHEFDLEVSFVVKKKQLGQIAERCINVHGVSIASHVLDSIKAQGYKYSTVSGTTVAVCDALIPEKKKEYLAEAEKKVDEITYNYNYGFITNEERSSAVIKAWEDCTNKVSNELTSNFDGAHNPIHMMVDSGARGSTSQLRQLAGMRGLIANTAGKTIEVPIRANYREGLNILEYFISSRGARKGLADTALRTADSGYLTRRLVDVSQDVIIRDDDCGCHDGIVVSKIMDGNRVLEPLEERLTGRFVVDPVVDPKTGEVLMEADRMMTSDDAKRIVDAGIESVKIRSLITCKSRHGVCRKCYGANLAFNEPVQVGEAVGIIAAQSIGEPGTQLTMRTFHTGGVAGGADITQGLPRVEELFEARKPKQLAILSEIEGDVRFEEIKKSRHVIVYNKDTAEEKKYLIPYGARLCENIVEGAHITKGTELTLGAVNPHDVLAILGEEAVYNYLIKEVQFAYRTQGVDINDKHIEVIVRQMLKKCTVDEAGDTDLVAGTMVDVSAVDEANDKIDARIKAGEENLKKATYIPILMGITKASLATDSFLSAASFQETTRVLTDAAIRGKSDPLIGLKENVIIGKLVPAGTGMDVFRKVDVVPSYFAAENSDEILNLEQLQELLTNTMQ